MKIIVPIVEFYDSFYKNYISEHIVKNFNEKETVLFQKIKSGKITTDKQAATLLYDGNPSGQAYSKMKQAFLDKLLKIVIFYESKNSTKTKKKVIALISDYHAFKIMMISNMSKATFALGKRIVMQAERLGIYEIGFDTARHIAMEAQIFLKDKKLGTKYWEKYHQLHSSYEDISKATRIYSDLMLLTKKKDFNNLLHEEATAAIEKFKPILDESNIRVMQFYYQVIYLSHAAISEHQGVIESHTKAIEFFSGQKNYYKSIIETLRIQLIISYLGTGQYEQASKYLETDTDEVNDHRWFNKVALKTRILFTLNKYNEANDLITKLFSSIRFKQTELPFQEQVWLYKYYNDLAMFFLHDKKVERRKIKNNMTRIVLDKRGLNIPLVIADCIYDVQQKGTTAIYKQEDMLRTYIKTHLKNSYNDRAAIFMKFLLALPNHEYDRNKFKDQLVEIQDLFRENPGNLTTKVDNEIIPYEDMMNMMLSVYVEKTSQPLFANQTSGSRASDY